MTKSQNPTTGTSVSYDSHAILINGKRLLFISAAIHYPRSTPAMWPKMMRRAKDAGINCIETYIFWNLHERVQGKYDFTHNLDFLHFIQCAHDIGLYVIVRIGPYICAETNYGGFPGWLRDAPGVENIRTNDEPFKKEMEKWVRLVGDMLRPTLAPNGGPVILLQIENEYGLVSNIYGEEGQKYLAWTIQLAHSLEMNVPWIMCMGSMPGAIDTINSFYGHTHIEKLRVERPDQPMIWTENWPGWCDVWTNPHRSRTAENVAYGSARFLAQGGTGINYYMYHGGTNFGVCSSYLQTTSYDYGAPLDEFGFVATKYKHLASFHKLIWKYSDLLLSIENSPKGVGIGENCLQFTFSDILSFICNDSDTGTDPVPVKVHFSNLSAPVEYLLPGRTVLIVDAKNGEILYDSSKVDVMSIVSRSYKPSDIALEWKQWAEPFPDTRPSVGTNPVTSETPVEMLGLTKDLSDYTWYSVALPAHAKSVTFNGIGDVAHVFVDHEYVASTKEDAIKEDRTPIDGADFIQEYNLPTRSTAATLNVLVSALGLIRGPGNVGNTNTVNEKKGIWGPVKVQIEDAEEAVVLKNWTVHPFLVGEHFGLDTEKAGLIASILPTTTPSSSAIIPRGQPRWYISAPFDVSLDDEEVGFSLNMNSMYKGAIFINGRHAGRHFITPTFPSADFWVKHFGDVIVEAEVGPPIQTRYHLPREWFKAMGNILVILEEGAKDVDIEKFDSMVLPRLFDSTTIIARTNANKLTVAVTALIASSIVLYFATPRRRKGKQIPGPRGYPLIGSIVELIKFARESKTYLFIEKLEDEYGSIAYTTVLGQPLIFTKDAALIHRSLTDTVDFYRNAEFEAATFGIIENALFSIPSGEKWKRHRKYLQPGFAPAQLRLAAKISSEETDMLLEYWDNQIILQNLGEGIVVDVFQEFTCLTLDIIGRIAFSNEFNAVKKYHQGESDEERNILQDIVSVLDQRLSTHPFVWGLIGVGKGSAKIKKQREYLNRLFDEITLAKSNRKSSGTYDLIDRLMDVDAKDTQRFTNEEIFGEVMGFFLAGHETTSNTLTFTAMEISRNHQVQIKLKKEIRLVLEQLGTVTTENISEFKYLDQVVKEAQRLHAVVPIVSRSVKNDVEHDGYIIPANAILVLSIRGVQLDPKFWKNPEIFDPERWEDPSSIAANSFLPFGEGPHNCIGQKMAVIEMKIILINLLSRFTLELIEDQEINFINTITLGLKNGLKLKVFAD